VSLAGYEESVGLPERQVHRDRTGGGAVGPGWRGYASLCWAAGDGV